MSLETLLKELNSMSSQEAETPKELKKFKYQKAIFDESFRKIPFVVNDEILTVVRNQTREFDTLYSKASSLHAWIMFNVEYGTRKRKDGYRNSIETFEDREGICGEMTLLYITMVRSLGIRANYVLVDRDHKNKNVEHACAILDIPGNNGQNMLVDNAYRLFDVKHKSYRPINDMEVFQRLNQ